MTRFVLALCFFLVGAAPFDPCPPLPRTPGPIITVTPTRANDLPGIVRGAASGTTILLADGTYRFTMSGEGARRLRFEKPNVTLRSASGNAEKVVIDAEYRTDEAIYITASDVTIAHLTVTHASHHLIHVVPTDDGRDIYRTTLYGVRLLDGGQQFVKINASESKLYFADLGRVECSTFLMTNAGRAHVPVAGDQRCYTGGIDAHSAAVWRVAWNRFDGIYCTNGALAEHAVHFWSASRATFVENNTIVNCGRGIGFGLIESGVSRAYTDNPYPGVGYIGHYDGVIRNNVIFSDIDFHDVGIELDQARGAKVHGNTIVSAKKGRFYTSIDVRFRNSLVEVFDNLVQSIKVRDGGQTSVLLHNVYDVGPEKLNAPWAGDYRLKIEPPALGVDMNGLPRKAGVAGAFEAP